MAVTIDLITVDFEDTPDPTVEFLQGRNMDVTGIRDTLREIEESIDGVLIEASPDPGGLIVKSSGNEDFNVDAGEKNALTVTILSPFVAKFQSGAIPYKTSKGNLNFKGLNSPGAIVQINNAVGAISLSSQDVEHSSYGNGVTIDVINGVSGTTGTIGNKRQPSNNLTDSKTIAASRGITELFIIGDMTFVSTDIIDGFLVKGVSSIPENTFTIDAGCSTAGSKFQDCHLQGTVLGNITCKNVHLKIVNNIGYSSLIVDSIFKNDVTYVGAGTLSVIRCGSGIPNGAPKMGWAGVPVARANIQSWSGGLELTGITTGDVSVDFVSGKLIVGPSNTGGKITVRPEGVEVVDNSGGTEIVQSFKIGTVVADAGNSSSQFKTDLPDTDDNQFRNLLIRFMRNSTLAGQTGQVSTSDGGTKILVMKTNKGFNATPVVGDKFEVINK